MGQIGPFMQSRRGVDQNCTRNREGVVFHMGVPRPQMFVVDSLLSISVGSRRCAKFASL